LSYAPKSDMRLCAGNAGVGIASLDSAGCSSYICECLTTS